MADTGVVGSDGQVGGALVDQAVDQGIGLADGAEAADQHGRTVLDACHGVGHVLDDLVDHACCVPSRFLERCTSGVAPKGIIRQTGRHPEMVPSTNRAGAIYS